MLGFIPQWRQSAHSWLSLRKLFCAIRHGEVDALVMQEHGEEEIYSLQRFDSAYRIMVEECFPYGVWLAEENGRLLYVTARFSNYCRQSE